MSSKDVYLKVKVFQNMSRNFCLLENTKSDHLIFGSLEGSSNHIQLSFLLEELLNTRKFLLFFVLNVSKEVQTH